MAQITGAANERVFGIQKWLGLHESPDGDTKLKMGEAAVMRNWKVTRDGSLQKRPGTREVLHISSATPPTPVSAVWTGYVGGTEYVVAICGKYIGKCTIDNDGVWHYTTIGNWTSDTDHDAIDNPHMFGFDGKLYVLSGYDYFCWDGSTFSQVVGYRPLVAINVPPNGGGELLESVNKLNGLRRCWISGDNSGKNFPLPLGGTIDSTSVAVIDNSTGQATEEAWSYSDGVVSFTSAPPEGTNNFEIQWEVQQNYRDSVCAMRYSETYNGTQDTRVFLYGDGGSDAFYSGLDYDGKARADYFPDLNQIRIGVKNTPITGMIRQLSRLICFKTDGAWSIQFGNVTDADGNLIAAFYSTPINKTIGNDAMGQVQLVLNDPITLFGTDLYEWKPNSYGNLTADERNASRISDRVYQSLEDMDLKSCRAFDDNYHQEYYVFDGNGKALVWNYAANAWYAYENFPMWRPFSYHGELYYGSATGGIQHVSEDYLGDNFDASDLTEQSAIDCHWESGSMSFGMDYQRKYSAMLWLGIKPESRALVEVTVQTDKNADYQQKEVVTHLFGFDNVDFGDFTFDTNRKPQMKRLKIKAKKFVYYKLILKSSNTNAAATVTSADVRVRFTGYTK